MDSAFIFIVGTLFGGGLVFRWHPKTSPDWKASLGETVHGMARRCYTLNKCSVQDARVGCPMDADFGDGVAKKFLITVTRMEQP